MGKAALVGHAKGGKPMDNEHHHRNKQKAYLLAMKGEKAHGQ